jgi:release factor glutamine methyltransferase
MIVKSKDLFIDVLRQVELSDKDEAKAIVEYLFQSKFGLSRIGIMTNREIEVNKVDLTEIIARVNRHEPIQYITQTAWFAGRKFFVNSSVLIPRPETESIVDFINESSKPSGSVLDVGTGSGCIAISIKLKNPTFDVHALDISKEALDVARKNAALLGADVSFKRYDFLDDDIQSLGTFDFLVSNPPYVLENEKNAMEKTVLDYEPHLALFVPNDDPLLFYRALAEKGKNNHGQVVAEINPVQATATADLFSNAGFAVDTKKDLEGKNRTLIARLRN